MNPAVVAIPITLAVLIILIYGWRRTMFTRKRRAEELARLAAEAELLRQARYACLPNGGEEVSAVGGPSPLADHTGRTMFILNGSFAEGVGTDALTLLYGCGMDGMVGSILLIEADRRRRQRFKEGIPQVYYDRLVEVDFPGITGGFGNADPEAVLAKIGRWGPAVTKKAEAVCELHQRLHHGDEAALGLVFVSEGGSAVIGTKAVETIGRIFKQMKFYGFTALPVDDRLTSRTKRIVHEYQEVGVQGFVVSSNLFDEVRNDFGMVASIVGFASASETADASVEQNNAWYLLFDEAPGGLVSYSTFVRYIPGYRLPPTHPAVRPRYYVYGESVLSTLHTGFEEVYRPEYHALGLSRNGSVPFTSRFDIGLAAVEPAALKLHEDELAAAQVAAGISKRNYHRLVAPIATQVDPQRILCPVGVVSLQALLHPGETLDELVKPPLELNGNGRRNQRHLLKEGAA